MVRESVKMAFIESAVKRKVVFNKRAKSLVKGTNELAILCGVDCCLIAINPDGVNPVVWPSEPGEMEQVLSKYTTLPQYKKERNRLDLKGFMERMIAKMENECRRANRRKEVWNFVCECLAGQKSLDKFRLLDLIDMSRVMGGKLEVIKARLDANEAYGKEVIFIPNNTPEPTEGNGKEELIVFPSNPETLTEATGAGKGKEVMEVLPFDLNMLPYDLNKVKTEKDDPDIASTNGWADTIEFQPVINHSNMAEPSRGPDKSA